MGRTDIREHRLKNFTNSSSALVSLFAFPCFSIGVHTWTPFRYSSAPPSSKCFSISALSFNSRARDQRIIFRIKEDTLGFRWSSIIEIAFCLLSGFVSSLFTGWMRNEMKLEQRPRDAIKLSNFVSRLLSVPILWADRLEESLLGDLKCFVILKRRWGFAILRWEWVQVSSQQYLEKKKKRRNLFRPVRWEGFYVLRAFTSNFPGGVSE